MNIVLKQEDADLILKYIRADLRRVTKAIDEITEKFNELQQSCPIPENSAQAILIFNAISEFKKDVFDTSTEVKTDLAKCIELLTIGSEVSDEESK